MSTTAFDPTADILDVRDLIDRFEELEVAADNDEMAEFKLLSEVLQELCGNGGDEQWRGDWYPLTLIRDSYMQTYAQDTAEDCGMLQDSTAWPYTYIDWEQATREFKMDYTSIDINDITYWYR